MTAPPNALRRVVAAHLGSEQVSRVVYGTVVGLALVVALEQHPPAPEAVAVTIVSTAIAVGLAELYSEMIGARVRRRRAVEDEQRTAMMADVVAVAVGAAFPAVFFVIAATGAIEEATAFTVAKWTGLGLISLYGFVASRLAGSEAGTAVLHAGGVALIGALVIALKALVH
jgi:uncharacterized membrane protein